MFMMFSIEDGKRKYSLKEDETKTAHPARFSTSDPYSRERLTIKKRFNIFPYDQIEQKND